MSSDQGPGSSRLFLFLGPACVVAISLASAVWLWCFVREFPDPSGANGYFYLKQIESLASGVGFYFKDYSLAFLLPTFILKITGDPLLSFQCATVVTFFLATIASGLLTWNLLKEQDRLVRAFYSCLVTVSLVLIPQVYEFFLTFYKNAFALMLFTGAMVVYQSSLAPKKRMIGTLVFMMLALLSHKSMLLLTVAFFISLAIQHGYLRRSFKKLSVIFAAILFAAGIFLWHFEKGSAYLAALLRTLSPPSGWWLWAKALRDYNPEMAVTLCGLACIGIAYVFLRNRWLHTQRVFGDGLLVVLVLAIHPFQMPGTNGPSYRLLLMLPVLALPWFANSIGLLRLSKQALLFVAVALFLPYYSLPLWGVRQIDDVFTPWAAIREDVLRIKEFVTPEDHLTSHHGLEFFIDEVTGIRSRSFLSDHPEKKDYRVAFVAEPWLTDAEAQSAIRKKALLEIGSEYVLVPETDWQKFVMEFHIPKHWKNPEEHRPDFIYE